MPADITRAMLFAAGLGTRMGALTANTPKPMIQVAGRPLLDYGIRHFEAFGCTRVVINTHYLAEQVHEHVATLSTRAELCISFEDPILETGGGIVKALPLLGEGPFFSANSDTIWLDGTEPALARLAAAFDAELMDALLLLHPLERAVGYRGPGNFALAEDASLLRSADAPYVFTGLQVLHPRLFGGLAPEPFSLRELYRRAEDARGHLVRMFGLVHDGDWLHVGTPEELAEAEGFLSP
jgi:MurNAc alpha-1-phosphate uridylyltransferase